MESKKEILIHIGTHKTGTSSIQKSLTKAFRLGHLGEICYPLLMGKYHHRQIATLYYEEYQDLPRWFKSQYSSDGFNDMKQTCRYELFEKLKNSDKIILSSEYLEDFSPNQIQEFHADLSCLGDVDFRIVIYIREPAPYYLSYVQQELKASSKFSVPQNFHYSFLKTIQLWSDVFSRQNLDIRLFQPQKFPEQSVIVDFQNCASDFFQLKVELENTIYLNKSLSAEGIMILQNYRKSFHTNADQVFRDDSNTLISLLQSSISEVEQTKAKLSPEVARLVTTLHQEDIHTLNKNYGVDISDFGIVQDSGVEDDKYVHSDLLFRGDKVEDILESFDAKNMFNLMLWLLQKQINQTQVNPSSISQNLVPLAPVQNKSPLSQAQPRKSETTKTPVEESGFYKHYQRIFKWFEDLLNGL